MSTGFSRDESLPNLNSKNTRENKGGTRKFKVLENPYYGCGGYSVDEKGSDSEIQHPFKLTQIHIKDPTPLLQSRYLYL